MKINTENAIKNMKWIVILIAIGTGSIAYVVQISLESFDLLNVTSLTVEIAFGTFIALVVYVYAKRQHEENKILQTETEKRIAEAVEQASNEIVQKVVEIANAQLRVKDGGKVALRKGGSVGADIVRNISEEVSIGESVVAVVKKGPSTKVVSENQVKHSTDTIVAENKKTFTVDAILITEEQQIEDLKKELNEAKKLYAKLYSKKRKGSSKREKKSK